MSRKEVVEGNNSAIRKVSYKIAEELVKAITPEEVDELETISEEYFEWVDSQPSAISAKDQRLGFGLGEAVTIAAAIFPVVYGLLKDLREKRRFIKAKLSIKEPEETAKILGDYAYNIALEIGLDKAKAKQLSDHLVQTLSTKPLLFVQVMGILKNGGDISKD